MGQIGATDLMQNAGKLEGGGLLHISQFRKGAKGF